MKHIFVISHTFSHDRFGWESNLSYYVVVRELQELSEIRKNKKARNCWVCFAIFHFLAILVFPWMNNESCR